MQEFKKSQFVARLYDCAASLNHDARFRNNPDDEYHTKYLAFVKMAEREVVPAAHGWTEGKGYTNECSINRGVLFIAGLLRRKDTAPMEEVVGNAMILLEYTEAAWEDYQVLLANYLEVKRGLLAGLHSIAAENRDRAGMN